MALQIAALVVDSEQQLVVVVVDTKVAAVVGPTVVVPVCVLLASP